MVRRHLEAYKPLTAKLHYLPFIFVSTLRCFTLTPIILAPVITEFPDGYINRKTPMQIGGHVNPDYTHHGPKTKMFQVVLLIEGHRTV